MRFFTLVIATFFVAISANASEIQKLELTRGYQICTRDIKKSTEIFTTVKTKVKNLTPPGLESTIGKFYDPNSRIFPKLFYCCNTAAPNMNAEDAKAVPDFLSFILNEYDSLILFLASNQMRTEKSKETDEWAYKFASITRDKIEGLAKCFKSDDKAFIDKLDNIYSKLQDPDPL